MTVKNILDEVLKENKPGRKESAKVKRTVDEFISKIKERNRKLGYDVEIMLGGSVAKGTFISGKFDSDIFFRFSREYPDEKLSDMLGSIISPFRPRLSRIHGSRDYFQLRYKSVDFELVPVYRITKPWQAVNVTDASPLHVKWIKKNLKKKLRDDIILAKMFCRAQEVYGAESYIKGFSGHVIDILVIHYGSFLNLLQKAEKWKQKTVIDVMGHGKCLSKSKTSGPLVVIDPVQPDRNAAAALSREKFNKFKNAARNFLKKPSKDFFRKKELSLRELKEKAGENRLIIVNVTANKGKEDVVGCRLLKGFQYLNKCLKKHDFHVLDSGWMWDRKTKCLYWFIIEDKELSKNKVWTGPPLKSKEHVVAFKKKYKCTFVNGKRICAEVKREFRSPEKLLNACFSEPYMKTKARCKIAKS